MKVSYKASNRFTIEAEGNTHKEVFTNLASLTEVFGVDKCGKCGCEDIVPIIRKAEDKKKKVHTFYELKCRKCFAKFSFGQHLTGDTLFPQRKDPDTGEYKPDGGWVKFVKEDE